MDSLLLIFILLISALVWILIPAKAKNVVNLLILLLLEYLRPLALYHNVTTSTVVNYLSIALYAIIILYCVLFRSQKTKRIMKSPFRLLVYFWGLYLFSAIFSVLLYNLEPKFPILIAFKVAAFLCVAANVESSQDVLVCIYFTLGMTLIDYATGLTSNTQLQVALGDRNLGVIPWLRYDGIWLSQALLWGIIATRKPTNVKKRQVERLVKQIQNIAIVVILGFIVVYGIVTVQLRVQIGECILGLVIVFLVSSSRARSKMTIYGLLIVVVGVILWGLFDTTLQVKALDGLFNRGDGGRLQLWANSLSFWLESPFYGHGFGTDGMLIARLDLANLQTSHNVYLTLLNETGIFGLIAWLYIQLYALKLEFHSFRSRDFNFMRRDVLTFIALHVTLMFHIFFHGIIYFPWVIIIPALSFTLFDKSPSTESVTNISDRSISRVNILDNNTQKDFR